MLSEVIILTNISRSSPHTTSWFATVRHQHLKTNLQGLLPRVHILIVSISNLKLPVFGLFSRFVHTLIIKISSSEEPANSTSIHRVRNGGKLVILFHPSPKNITKRCRSPSWYFSAPCFHTLYSIRLNLKKWFVSQNMEPLSLRSTSRGVLIARVMMNMPAIR